MKNHDDECTCNFYTGASVLCLLNWLQHIQRFINIAILAHKQLGQPATIITESHGHHLVYCISNMWSCQQINLCDYPMI